MMRIVVIGAGITGLFVSYYLRNDGHEVFLVDTSNAGSITSVNNAGLITPSFSPAPPIGIAELSSTIFRAKGALRISPAQILKDPGWFIRAAKEGVSVHQKEVMDLGFMSLDLYNAFFEKEKLQVDLQRGILGVYRDADRARTVADEVNGEFLNEKKLAEIGYRGLGGGIIATRDISIDPSKLYNGLFEKVRALNVKLFLGKRAALKSKGNEASVLIDNEKILESDACVVASGAMSRELLASVGYRPAVLPARGLSVYYDTGGTSVVPMPTLLEDYGIALVQHDASRVRLTSFFELVGYKESFAESRIRWMEETASSHFPKLDVLREEKKGIGYRPCTPDQVPLIGRVPKYSNLYIATGNCRLGVTLAPVTARIVCSSIGGREPADIPWKLFDPARFA